MIERFLTQTSFTSEEDYKRNLHFKIPENFNFAYDVMDAWAEECPDKLALLWTSERGEEVRATFAELKDQTDRTAAYFQSLGIGHGDKVMLILKRHYQWWLSMLALHKLGAVAIPATHMLTKHDIVYRDQRASVKAIVCANDEYVTSQILADCTGRTVEVVASPQNVGAVGAAVISAVGLGMIGSIEEAKKLVPAKKTFIPNPSLKPIYDKNFAVFKNLYKSNKENFAALNG